MKTVKFITLGCKVNQYDTQSIRERFLKAGFTQIYNGKPADMYLVDTCTVTASADRKSRNAIHSCIRENPRAKVIVTGCLVEEDANALADIPGVSFIISKKFFPSGISNFCAHTRAFLKIQDGCDNFCSYCKVPMVRGRSRSRSLDEIISDARGLVKNNFKEIVLCGICLGAYGRDLEKRLDLVDAIEAIERINGLLRIRLSSIETGDVSDRLINKIKQSKKLCRHLHIPIQSGDDGILKKMNRRYSSKDYLNLIRKIKRSLPGIAITTDVLVGFPGETDKSFRNTVSLLKKILPLRTHIFPYSNRPGTSASMLRDKINASIIKERVLLLTDVARDCSLNYRKQFFNKDGEVLIEGHPREDNKYWEGYTDNYMEVWVKSGENLKNQLVHVKFRKLNKDCIEADLL